MKGLSMEEEIGNILNEFGTWCFNKGMMSDLGAKPNGSFQYKVHKNRASAQLRKLLFEKKS